MSIVFLVFLEKEDLGKCDVCRERAASLKLGALNLFSIKIISDY